MLEGFVCPDNKIITIEKCLENCRFTERCLTLPSLELISREREWNGVASTTQLLNGTMMEYLKLTKGYTVDPDSRAFLLAGIKHHRALEDVAKELGLPAEVALNIDRDIFDLIEMEKDGLVLTDYKLWGSFKVAKALGIVEVGKIPDPSGAVYKTSGKWGKAGSPKMIPKFERVPGKINNWEAELQLNRYRIMLGDLGVKVNRMQLQVTVRDGGLGIARSRGIIRNIYRIPIQRLPDEGVKLYFKEKQEQLLRALEVGWKQPCSEDECWEGVRCERYCDVAHLCPKGQILKGGNKDETYSSKVEEVCT